MTSKTGALFAAREVALLVEDPIVRQQNLAVDSRELAAVGDRSAVVDAPLHVVRVERGAGVERLTVHQFRHARDDDDVLARRDQPVELGPRVQQELPLEEQILRWVARECELRERYEVGALLLGLAHEREHPVNIPLEVADCGIDLPRGLCVWASRIVPLHNPGIYPGTWGASVLPVLPPVTGRKRCAMRPRGDGGGERSGGAARRAFSPFERKNRRSLCSFRMPLRVTAALNRETIPSGGSPSLISTYAIKFTPYTHRCI